MNNWAIWFPLTSSARSQAMAHSGASQWTAYIFEAIGKMVDAEVCYFALVRTYVDGHYERIAREVIPELKAGAAG